MQKTVRGKMSRMLEGSEVGGVAYLLRPAGK